MKTRNVAALLAMVGALACLTSCSRPHAESISPAPPTTGRDGFSAPGRIEGASETVRVGLARDGVVEQLFVTEGQAVHRGDVLARLDCRDVAADGEANLARYEEAVRKRERLLRGGRPDERLEAEAMVKVAEAGQRKADLDVQRARTLLEGEAISRAEVELAEKNYATALHLLDAAKQRVAVVTAAPLPEDIRAADAEIDVWRQERNASAARLDMCSARAPTDGVVLKVMLHAGERATTAAPAPLLLMADLSKMRVRAEVDERDVARAIVGTRVTVVADAWSGQPQSGVVSAVTPQMGRKLTRTTDPSDKSDRDVLDVLIDFDTRDARQLVGLRVAVVFDAGKRGPY